MPETDNRKQPMYRMKADRVLRGELMAAKDTIVYDCAGYDYGCAGDDTRAFGFAHKSVTLDPTGDYPFFTVPVHDLEPISEAPADAR